MKTKAFSLLIAMFLIVFSVGAQESRLPEKVEKSSQTNFEQQRSIRLDNDSKAEEIPLEISPKTWRFKMDIKSSIRKGKLTIEIYDPSNTRQGNFTVETLLNSDKQEVANGSIRKSLVEPQVGTWKIKIIPSGATGDVSIRSEAIIAQ